MAAFIAQHRVLIIAAAAVFVLLLIALLTLILGLKRGRKMDLPAFEPEKPGSGDQLPNAPMRIQKAKLAIGDAASPWTQGVYERHSPEDKINHLLPAFAFDEAGNVHRSQDAELVKGADITSTTRHCDTASGLAVHGAYATLLLWHSGDPGYAVMALKVMSHAHMAPEQKELIRFLFQDVAGQSMRAQEVPGLTRWGNPVFRAAVQLYVSRHIQPSEWEKLEKILPPAFSRLYELELAQKLPLRTVYKRAAESVVFAEGLYRLNLAAIAQYKNGRRWLRVLNSDKAPRIRQWIKTLPCRREDEALLHIANPEIYDKEDLSVELQHSITAILDATDTRNWLFHHGKKPSLIFRLHYFKYFCLFERHNEAVRCFATLAAFRRDRASRLYYARALFACGMHHEAWAEMSALLSDYPRDASVMNEAAIYAHKLGRHDEAADIFAMARGMYPDDATLAYNEAIFTEQYSKVQIQEKWSAVQKMTAPPVVE